MYKCLWEVVDSLVYFKLFMKCIKLNTYVVRQLVCRAENVVFTLVQCTTISWKLRNCSLLCVVMIYTEIFLRQQKQNWYPLFLSCLSLKNYLKYGKGNF